MKRPVSSRNSDDSDKFTEEKKLPTRLDFTTFQSSLVCETPDNIEHEEKLYSNSKTIDQSAPTHNDETDAKEASAMSIEPIQDNTVIMAA